MKLRIGQDDNGFWLEQKWVGLFWRRCRVFSAWIRPRDKDPVQRMIKDRIIRFGSDRISLPNLEEAKDYSHAWWLAYSFKGRKEYNKLNKKTHRNKNYLEINPQIENTKILLKEGA
jgi:hypothetical protein